MRVTIRAFTKEGYHRDILVVSPEQVHMTWGNIKEELLADRCGAVIRPDEFPEMVAFQVIIRD